MDLDKSAARAVKRRNNRTRRELPLLAAADAIPEDMLTSETVQKERIARQRKAFEVWWADFERRREEYRQLALRYRAECQELVDEETFAQLDAHQPAAHLDPVYSLDYWHRQAAKIDPRYCPMLKDGHINVRWFEPRPCPICGVMVAPYPREDLPEQPSLLG